MGKQTITEPAKEEDQNIKIDVVEEAITILENRLKLPIERYLEDSQSGFRRAQPFLSFASTFPTQLSLLDTLR